MTCENWQNGLGPIDLSKYKQMTKHQNSIVKVHLGQNEKFSRFSTSYFFTDLVSAG